LWWRKNHYLHIREDAVKKLASMVLWNENLEDIFSYINLLIDAFKDSKNSDLLRENMEKILGVFALTEDKDLLEFYLSNLKFLTKFVKPFSGSDEQVGVLENLLEQHAEKFIYKQLCLLFELQKKEDYEDTETSNTGFESDIGYTYAVTKTRTVYCAQINKLACEEIIRREKLRENAVKNIENLQILENVARYDLGCRVRLAAIEQISDSVVLSRILSQPIDQRTKSKWGDEWEITRLTAIEKIKDEKVLVEAIGQLASQTSYSPEVFKKAIEKISQQSNLTEIAVSLIGAFGDLHCIVEDCAIEILVKIGEAAVPALIRRRVGRCSAQVLYGIGDKAKAAIPDLVKAVDDSDEVTRRYATEALGNMADVAVPALIEAVGDPGNVKEKSLTTLHNIVIALGIIGEKAESAIPILKKVLKIENEYTRRVAAEAIKKITKD